MKDLRAKHTFLRLLESTMILLRATKGARNPNLQVVTRMRRMYVASSRLNFH